MPAAGRVFAGPGVLRYHFGNCRGNGVLKGDCVMKQLVVALNCPKGGVGKTTLAKELASLYGSSVIEGTEPKVCIVDANVYWGDVGSMLKLHPSDLMVSWADKIAADGADRKEFLYPEETVESFLLPAGIGSLKVLPAPSSPAGAAKITYGVMRSILYNLKNCYDIIIVDTGNNTSDCTVACFEQATKILLVVTDESTSINCASSLLGLFPTLGLDASKAEVVVNKYETDRHLRYYPIEEIEEVLGDVYATLSADENMPRINSSGIPAVLGKDTPFRKDIVRLAAKMEPGMQAPAAG